MGTLLKNKTAKTIKNVATITIKIENCHECQFKKVEIDPDPDDWFNDDDVKVVCTKKRNKVITSACRPYNIKKECVGVPDWCPLLKK